MKLLSTFFVLIFVMLMGVANGQVTLVDFDDNDWGFESWGSALFAKVENPYSEGINTSANVGQFSYSGGDWWSGVYATSGLEAPIDFKATPFVRMKVYSSDAIMILFKFENAADGGINSELRYQMTEDETNKWTEIVYNFSDVSITNLDKVVLFFDPERNTTGTSFYFDEITASNVAPGGKLTYSPANESDGIITYSQLKIESNLAVRMIDDSAITDPTSVLALKKGNSEGEDVPFTGYLSADKKAFVFDPTEMLDSSAVYWYGIKDNTIEWSEGEAPVNGASATFTTINAVLPMFSTLTDFDDIQKTKVVESMGDPASPFSIENDPLNADNKVLKFDKGGSWGGWERIHIELKYPIIVEDGKAAFSIKVNSPKTSWVRFKIADAKDDGDIKDTKELDADITRTESWETLYFEFSDLGDGEYNHLFIFIDGGNGEAVTYYVDDIQGPDIAAPELTIDYSPKNEATNVQQFAKLQINTNYSLVNADNTEITDLTGKVGLKKGSANGEDVPFTASINGDKKVIDIVPSAFLDLNTSYWFGVIDNTLAFADNGVKVVDMAVTFTTRETAIDFTLYNDFDGNTHCSVVETMGDPAPVFNTSAIDPTNPQNTVLQVDKGGSWWGWERIHFELTHPIDSTGEMIFSFKVLSPRTGGMLVKVADAKGDDDMTVFTEMWVDVTEQGEWQTLYFDLTGKLKGKDIKHVLIFPEGGNTEATTYYFDDLRGAKLDIPVSVNEIADKSEFYIFPNPAKDLIHFTNVKHGDLVEVYSLLGEMVKREIYNGQNISIADLNKGMYFVKVNKNAKRLVVQ